MPDDDDLLPDPSDAEFFAKYIATCARLGVTPVSFDRARDLLTEWSPAFNSAADLRPKPD